MYLQAVFCRHLRISCVAYVFKHRAATRQQTAAQRGAGAELDVTVLEPSASRGVWLLALSAPSTQCVRSALTM